MSCLSLSWVKDNGSRGSLVMNSDAKTSDVEGLRAGSLLSSYKIKHIRDSSIAPLLKSSFVLGWSLKNDFCLLTSSL